jgi:hypothetical protein
VRQQATTTTARQMASLGFSITTRRRPYPVRRVPRRHTGTRKLSRARILHQFSIPRSSNSNSHPQSTRRRLRLRCNFRRSSRARKCSPTRHTPQSCHTIRPTDEPAQGQDRRTSDGVFVPCGLGINSVGLAPPAWLCALLCSALCYIGTCRGEERDVALSLAGMAGSQGLRTLSYGSLDMVGCGKPHAREAFSPAHMWSRSAWEMRNPQKQNKTADLPRRPRALHPISFCILAS